MRRNVWGLALFFLGIVGVDAAVAVTMGIAGLTSSGLYLLGLLHAGSLAAWRYLVNSASLAHNHEALWQLRGAWGEDNTCSELQRAKRKRLIWDWIDSVELQAGDIDHLVVTRRGGLVAIDSK